MHDVISLADRRAASAGDDRRCVCGSEWFDLQGHGDRAPAVTVSSEGRITGYAGSLSCRDCGRMQ